MDITRLKNNAEYYNNYVKRMYRGRYAYDTEVVLTLKENPQFNIHFWEMFFDDIFEKPIFNDKPWVGFTRDYCEFKGAFANENIDGVELSNPQEYLQDMLRYAEKEFRHEETEEVFDLIADFLRYAIATGQTVVMEVS